MFAVTEGKFANERVATESAPKFRRDHRRGKSMPVGPPKPSQQLRAPAKPGAPTARPFFLLGGLKATGLHRQAVGFVADFTYYCLTQHHRVPLVILFETHFYKKVQPGCLGGASAIDWCII